MMKTKKLMLIAALICASVATVSAQQAAQPAPKHEFKLQKGDSVMIKRECERYLTGERPSTWVWDKVLTVRQLGTKRFPDGVLLMPILSWMCEECLIPVNGHTQEAKEEALAQHEAEILAEKEAKQAARDSIAAVKEERRDSIAAAKEEERAAEEAAALAAAEAARRAAALKAEQDSIAAAEQAAAEKARWDSIAAVQAAEQARLDSIAAEEAAAAELVAREKAKGDSIHSARQKLRGKYDRFTIGLRGGASSLLHNLDQGNWTCGGDAVLDIQYAHYWTNALRPVDLGLIIGASVGYSQSGMKAGVHTDTTYLDNSDPTFPMHIDYTVHADEVKEDDGQIQVEIPIMFSLITQKGFFFNIGPKFMLPVYTPFTQKISDNENTKIDAYFQEIGVPVTNEVITGVLAESQYTIKNTDNGNQFAINIMLGAELGYEWTLRSGNSFGLGVYGNYCLYNSFKNNTANIPLIEITPPYGSKVALVTVHSATKTYAKGLGFFDAGIKLAYHFNFPKKKKYVDSRLF